MALARTEGAMEIAGGAAPPFDRALDEAEGFFEGSDQLRRHDVVSDGGRGRLVAMPSDSFRTKSLVWTRSGIWIRSRSSGARSLMMPPFARRPAAAPAPAASSRRDRPV